MPLLVPSPAGRRTVVSLPDVKNKKLNADRTKTHYSLRYRTDIRWRPTWQGKGKRDHMKEKMESITEKRTRMSPEWFAGLLNPGTKRIKR